ncbi:hypothetical protein EVA_05352 [gut metagenome]|uniref:Uncharacterized protein n=1 Tax=gut metagenome TaxID=749906 RepID=J9D1U6_9ZZZZ
MAPFAAILLSTIAQAMIWPMYRDLFGEKHLFERQS